MARNDPIEVRIEKMATWAAAVQEQLDDLTTAMVVNTEKHADGLSYQLAELLETRRANQEQYADAMGIKARYSVPSTLDDQIKEAGARASLNAASINPTTGKLFTVQQCKDRITLALAEDADYQKLVIEKRKQKTDVARANAVIETLDREAKEYGRAVYILTARLNNLTARVGK